MPADAYQLDKPLIDDGNNRIRPVYSARNLALGGASGRFGGRLQLAIGDLIVWDDGSSVSGSGEIFEPETFGAVGDGVTDDGPAWQLALDAAAAAGGGVVQARAAVYLIGQTLDPGVSAPITVRGSGWRCTNMAGPGDASWIAGIGTTITGTVLKCTAATGGIDVSGANGKGLQIEHIALIGPGVGAGCVGVNLGTTATFVTQQIMRNVLLANFEDGLRLANTYDASYYDLNVYGCTNGVHVADDTTEQKFYALRIQACDVAVLGEYGADVRIFGGLVQGCKIGYKWAPALGGITAWSMHGIWFEGPAYDATAQMHFDADTTAAAVSDMQFSGCRAGTVCTFAPTVVNPITRWTFDTCDFAGLTIDYQADMTRFAFTNVKLAELIVNGGGELSSCGLVTAAPNVSLTTQCRQLLPEQVMPTDAALAIDWRTGDTRLFYLEHDPGGGDVDVVVGLPTNAPDFAELTLLFQQRGGLRKLTWAAGYNIAWQDSWTTGGFACVKLIHVGAGSWIPLVPFAGWAYGAGPLHTTGATYSSSVAIDDGDSPYALPADVGFLRCDTSAGNPITVNLPSINTSEDRHLLIHDWGGTASVDPINIAAQGGETINGVASISITTDGGSAYVYCDGIEWRTVPTV